jgi:hypothetical protein
MELSEQTYICWLTNRKAHILKFTLYSTPPEYSRLYFRVGEGGLSKRL